MKFYLIDFDDGRSKYGELPDYAAALQYAESEANGANFTISEYESEDDFLRVRGII